MREGWREVAKFTALVGFVVVCGWLASTVGVTLFATLYSDRWTQAIDKHAERAALVVCGICVAGAVVSLVNLVLLWKWNTRITVTLPPLLDPFIRLIAAGFGGWLIGTTIFV